MKQNLAHCDSLPSNRRRWGVAVGMVLALAFLLPLLGTMVAGKGLAEKIITYYLMPTGLVVWSWIGLVAWQWIHHRKSSVVKLLIIGLIGYLLCSPILSNQLTRSLETRIPPVDYKNLEAMDMILVLGGGSGEDPHGRFQINEAGDRIIMAARLYHLGKVKKLVAVGSIMPGVSKSKSSGAEQTLGIWTELGIPESDILTAEGQTTFQEMQSFKALIANNPAARIGLITSAFHMPRALRLAKGNELNFIPIPCHYRYSNTALTFMDFLPSLGAFDSNQVVMKEWLASIVGR